MDHGILTLILPLASPCGLDLPRKKMSCGIIKAVHSHILPEADTEFSLQEVDPPLSYCLSGLTSALD